MSFAAPSRERMRPILPIASMIDILFLLLTFFLTASAFREQERAIDVSLPATQSERVGNTAAPIVITVNETGEIFMGQNTYTLETLRTTLTSLTSQYPDEAVVIRGDRESRLGTAVQVMDLAYELGLNNVYLATVRPN